MIIYYCALFIVQIIMLIKMIKKTNKMNYSILLSTIILSIINVIAFSIFICLRIEFSRIDKIQYLTYNAIAVVIFVFILITSSIIKVIISKKNNQKYIDKKNIEKNLRKKYLIINGFIIIITFLIFVFIEYAACKSRYENNKIADNYAKEQIINFLNQEYGDGKFKIVETRECPMDSFGAEELKIYKFIIDTDYFEKYKIENKIKYI